MMKTKAVEAAGKKASLFGNGLSHIRKLGWKGLRMWAAVCLLFGLSVLIRGLILPGPHVLNTYYDELLYWGIAKTFWTAPAFTLYHLPVEFSKFIYAMVLSPLFLVKDAVLRAELAGWLNTIMISFSVFPAYRLARKLTASEGIQLLCLALFMCSPIMNYGEKYAPECLYLPMSLYLMLGYHALFQRIGEPERSPMGVLCGRAALLGVFAHVCYLEKEAAAAFTGAFLIWTLITAVKGLKRGNGRRYLAAAGAHAGAFAVCYLAVKLILGVQFSYSGQVGLSNVDSMYKIEYLMRCVISNGLYICVALFGLPALYWQIRKNRQARLAEEDAVHRDWMVAFFIAFGLTLFFISYGISVSEELGNVKMRLHTRYIIPFLLPFLALVLEEMRKSPKRTGRAGVAVVLAVGVACVLLLSPNRYVSAYDSYDTWHLQDAYTYFDDLSKETGSGQAEETSLQTGLRSFFAKQTDGSKEISYNHGLLISLSVFTLLTVLIVLLTGRRKKAAIALFCCLILAVEGYNNVVSVKRISTFGSIPESEARAYAQLDRDVGELTKDGNLLIISTEKLEAKKRKIETFFAFDWYSVLTKDLKRLIGPNGVIDVCGVEMPVSLKQFASGSKYPKGTAFDYVLCTDDIRFNARCVEQLLYSRETGYTLYRVIDPTVLDVDYVKDVYEE